MLMTPDTAAATRPAAFPLLTGDGQASPAGLRVILWLAWLVAAGWLALHHVVWRDEVRALTLALSGDNVGQMLWYIHGEGHPALWYLLLRAGYPLLGKAVLPVAAFVVAAAATALVAWRAPFRPLVIGAVLFSAYALVDYAVVARNYGVSFLIMAAIAALYPSRRDRGVTLGVLLFLLSNTNAPAVLLAGGFVLFWGVELWLEQGWRWTPAARQWLLNAGIAAVGVLACAATIYPPYNDAASMAAGSDGGLFFGQLSAGLWRTWPGWLLFIVVLIGSLAGLARAPAALVASATVLVAGGVFFQLVYPGLYRHQAMFLIFLLAMYWLVANGRGGTWPAEAGHSRRLAMAQRYGAVAFAGLLSLQTVTGLKLFDFMLHGDPFSRSRDLGKLLERSALRRAVVIGNPDVLLEPLPYYASNPTWFVRERRWGRVVAFSKAAMRDVSLGEILDTARRLRAATGRPVVIVLARPVDPSAPAGRWPQGYLGGFTWTPQQSAAFIASTRFLVDFGPAQTDESYHVYLLA